MTQRVIFIIFFLSAEKKTTMLILRVLFLVVALSTVHGHTYHMGSDCPTVEPMSGFNMDKVSTSIDRQVKMLKMLLGIKISEYILIQVAGI